MEVDASKILVGVFTVVSRSLKRDLAAVGSGEEVENLSPEALVSLCPAVWAGASSSSCCRWAEQVARAWLSSRVSRWMARVTLSTSEPRLRAGVASSPPEDSRRAMGVMGLSATWNGDLVES